MTSNRSRDAHLGREVSELVGGPVEVEYDDQEVVLRKRGCDGCRLAMKLYDALEKSRDGRRYW